MTIFPCFSVQAASTLTLTNATARALKADQAAPAFQVCLPHLETTETSVLPVP